MDCEAAVRVALAETGCSIDGLALLGARETYIRATIAHGDIVLYIYEDEAQLRDTTGLIGLYEAPDYPSSNDLQRAFVAQVVSAAGSRSAID